MQPLLVLQCCCCFSSSYARILPSTALACRYGGRIVAKLPFEPFSLLRSLSQRGLKGPAITDCAFVSCASRAVSLRHSQLHCGLFLCWLWCLFWFQTVLIVQFSDRSYNIIKTHRPRTTPSSLFIAVNKSIGDWLVCVHLAEQQWYSRSGRIVLLNASLSSALLQLSGEEVCATDI